MAGGIKQGDDPHKAKEGPAKEQRLHAFISEKRQVIFPDKHKGHHQTDQVAAKNLFHHRDAAAGIRDRHLHGGKKQGRKQHEQYAALFFR